MFILECDKCKKTLYFTKRNNRDEFKEIVDISLANKNWHWSKEGILCPECSLPYILAASEKDDNV
jgi:hypothetical protein